MTDASWDTPYIHGTNPDANKTSHTNNFDAVFTVYLSDRKHEFSPENFLQACWTDGFDTPCTICREAFDLATEPPVRLLSLGQHTDTTDPLTKKLPPLSVSNYHLKCLKANEVEFIPVSHPWHASVAGAYALRTFNEQAAQICYEAPVRTLLAVKRHLGPDCLLWHDYISIPQWRADFRGTFILPQIFKIFEASRFAILHLDYQPPAEVVRTPTLGTISEHSNDLKQFFKAHLFSRLWPIVESDRAGDAYIMSNEYGIMETKFSVFIKQIFDAVNACAATTFQISSSQWIYELPLFVQERQKNKCLGYVYDMIADLGCRSSRDKFIGAAELLGISDYPKELPKNTQDACLWLAKKRIMANDLSPLLLRPSSEPIYEKACWLKGHGVIEKNMWGWGIQTHSAYGSPQLQEHNVHLEMHLVGNITHEFSWHLRADGRMYCASDELISLITTAHGSTAEFLGRLSSVPPASIFRSTSRGINDQVPALEWNVASSKILTKIVGNLLERRTASETTDNRSADSLRIYDSMVSLLVLSASVPTANLDHFGSLNFHQLHQQICDPYERSLVSICCSSCLKYSVFRVELWQKPMTETRLYLIPGLKYQYTAASGAGIIIEAGVIIGRARFCASTCDCNSAITVKIT